MACKSAKEKMLIENGGRWTLCVSKIFFVFSQLKSIGIRPAGGNEPRSE